MPPASFYRRAMHRQYDYLATWFPNVHLQLGDVVVIKGYQIRKVSDLKSLGIKFDVEIDPTPSNLELTSSQGVNVVFKASGKIIPKSNLLDVDAGFNVTFAGNRGFAFCANGVRENSIKDSFSLRQPIIDLYKQGRWDKYFMVITSLVEADSGTVIISMKRDASIDLKATGKVNANTINLADLTAALQTSFSSGIHTQIISDKGCTPLFKAEGIITRSSRLALSKNVRARGDEPHAFRDEAFETLTPERAKKDMSSIIDFGEIAYREEEDDESVA